MKLFLSSPAFSDGGKIPPEYTCDGENISPQLSWGGVPEGTKSLALIMDDPDAPGSIFVHWVMFNVPPGTTGVSEATPLSPILENGAIQGMSSYDKTGYGGPCPPPGPPHHYRFTLYALDKTLSLKSKASKEQVLKAADGHILAQCRLTGLYQR